MKTLIIALAITITGMSTSMGTSMGTRPTKPVKTETITVTESSKVGEKSGWMTSIEDLDNADIIDAEIILR